VKEATLYRSTGNIAVIAADTCTVDPSSSTKETTADNNGAATTHPGIYKKAVVPDGRGGRPRHLLGGQTAAEKSSTEPSVAGSGATSASSATAGTPRVTASAFWDLIMGRGGRRAPVIPHNGPGRACRCHVGERAAASQATEEEREPGAQGAAHNHHHTGSVRPLLDAVAPTRTSETSIRWH